MESERQSTQNKHQDTHIKFQGWLKITYLLLPHNFTPKPRKNLTKQFTFKKKFTFKTIFLTNSYGILAQFTSTVKFRREAFKYSSVPCSEPAGIFGMTHLLANLSTEMAAFWSMPNTFQSPRSKSSQSIPSTTARVSQALIRRTIRQTANTIAGE